MAYNSLGKSDSFDFVESVQSAINEEVLRHLDLSYNRMKKVIWEKLGMLIYDNHTLYGIHMEGNEAYVDKYGFIQTDIKSKYQDISKNSIIYPKTLNGFSTTMKFSKDNKYQYRPTVNWWICEGWTENTFEVKLGKSFSIIEDPVHIHFDYNYFKPELMRWIKGETYTYTTMCPPGKIKYFFTIDKIAVFAKDHPKSVRKFPKQIQNIEMYDEVKTYNISRFNYRICEQGQILDDWYIPLLPEWMPRVRQLKYRNKTQYRIKEQWIVEKSIFADYIPDSQQLIDQLFEADWALIQKPKFSDDEELDKVKAELKKAYWSIRDAFKYYSSISSSTGSWTFALSLNSYTDYLKYAGVYKNKNITITDTDTLFFTTNKREKATILNPGNALIRYQFLEIMFRLALKHSKRTDPAESIQEFTTKIIENSLKAGKAQEFRIKRYWNEHWDNVYRFHLELLKEVYNNYSGALTKPGEERYMSPGEFERIFIAANLFSPTFANRDVYVWFNMAMQSRVDEHTSDAHLKMTFVEFMEAIGRAAELMSLAPPSDEIRDLYKKDLYTDELKGSKDYPEKKETTTQLDLKFELDLEDEKNREAVEMSEQEHINQPLHK